MFYFKDRCKIKLAAWSEPCSVAKAVTVLGVQPANVNVAQQWCMALHMPTSSNHSVNSRWRGVASLPDCGKQWQCTASRGWLRADTVDRLQTRWELLTEITVGNRLY